MEKKKCAKMIVIAAMVIYLVGCGRIEISAKSIKIELGDSVPIKVADYINVDGTDMEKVTSKIDLDLSNINPMAVGEYQAIAVYKGQRLVIPVIVEDTTPPIIEVKNIEFLEGDRVSPSELADVIDLSETRLYIQSTETGENLDGIVLRPNMTIILKAVDKYDNQTVALINPDVAEEKDEESERSFDSFLRFRIEKACFVNEEVYTIIKDAYSEIDWKSEFEIGNLEEYAFYKKKFCELITNEKPYYDDKEGKEIFLKDYHYISSIHKDLANTDVAFYFFDMDQDGNPELGIETVHFILIIKYDKEKDRFYLWKKYETTYYELNGSRTVRYENGGNVSGFYKLDENGKEVLDVFFECRGYWDEETNEVKGAYMVTLPQYSDVNKQIKLTEDIKGQGYFFTLGEQYYFRVTEEQYNELTKDFFEAKEEAKEKLQEITYTYDEFVKEEDADN